EGRECTAGHREGSDRYAGQRREERAECLLAHAAMADMRAARGLAQSIAHRAALAATRDPHAHLTHSGRCETASMLWPSHSVQRMGPRRLPQVPSSVERMSSILRMNISIAANTSAAASALTPP